MDKQPYFEPSIDVLAEVKALTLREEAKLLAQADPDDVATNKEKRGYNEMMNKALDDVLIEALGHKPLNSKDLRGASSKVPEPPRRAGLIKS